ncbi:MAG: radical SAM protein [Chloroflexota bacterium]
MANLVVTDVCNMKCSFCFAHDYLRKSSFISLEAFEQRLDFIERSDINEIRLIGGEPSLHPRFPELIALAQQRGKHIVVFSHGLLSERALACLESLPVEECTILINMNATRTPGQRNTQEQHQRWMTLRRLGQRALLGFNIFEANPQFDFILPLILEANCRRVIRLGLAHPILDGQNEYLHPKQYPMVGHKISQFAKTAAELGVKLELDCGFVRCMFSNDDMETLHQAQADIGWRCNPILDVDLTEQVFHCFPLSGKVHRPFFPDADARNLRALLVEQTRHYRMAGIYKECSTCSFRQRDECMGGCLANTMKRFQPAALRLRVPDDVVADWPRAMA